MDRRRLAGALTLSWISLLAVAFALAMDAFAVAIVSGLPAGGTAPRRVFRLAFHFGLFQALMPILGWCAGTGLHGPLERVDHWIAFGLLSVVGARMTWSAARQDPDEVAAAYDTTRGWSLVLLSVATSIDALAVGLSLAMLGSKILLPALVIGVVAATLTLVGMRLGSRIGSAWGRRVEMLGGLVLVGIGVKILIEHLRG
jgi:manganese efflux pump family protein